jgi:AraC family transcriptional regulator
MATPQESFSRTLQFIEENRDKAVSLDEIAASGGLNRFQLIRLYARLCGMTPMDYARGRRLAGSIPDLIRGRRILDIALDFGFEHEQSYIRAFRDAYRITPARFRRQAMPIPLTDVPHLEEFTISASGMLGKPRLMARPAFEMSGLLRYYNYADNLLDGLPLYEGLLENPQESYTAACRTSSANRFTHEYLIKSQADAPGAAFTKWRWPAGQWVRFQYIGLHPLNRDGTRRMRLLTSLVAGGWFSQRAGRWDGQFIEHVEPNWLGENYCEVELYCPVDVFPQITK